MPWPPTPPPPARPIPKEGENHLNLAYNMLYILWVVIFGDHTIKKISSQNFDFWAAHGEKLHQQVVHRPIYSCKPLLMETIILRLWQGF